MNSLGKRLRKARTNKGLNQVEVYKKTGINNKTLSRYENSGTEPDADSLRRLAEAYEVSVDWIVGNNQTNEQHKNKAFDLYEKLSDNKKKIIDDMIQALADERSKND